MLFKEPLSASGRRPSGGEVSPLSASIRPRRNGILGPLKSVGWKVERCLLEYHTLNQTSYHPITTLHPLTQPLPPQQLQPGCRDRRRKCQGALPEHEDRTMTRYSQLSIRCVVLVISQTSPPIFNRKRNCVPSRVRWSSSQCRVRHSRPSSPPG